MFYSIHHQSLKIKHQDTIMAKKSRRNLNANSTFTELATLIKEYIKTPGDLDESIKNLLMGPDCTLSKLFKFKYQRVKDVHIHKLEKLSCFPLTHSELLRSPAFQVSTEKELMSFKDEAFLNPIRIYLSMLAHHKISNVTSWHMEKTKLPAPRILARCCIVFPGRKFVWCRIDVARLCYPVWEFQHIFYYEKDYAVRQSNDYDCVKVKQNGDLDYFTAIHVDYFPKVGAGAPMCLQELKIRHDYKGNLKGIHVSVVLQGIGQSEPHMYDIRHFHDKLQRFTYSQFMKNIHS